MQLTLGCESSVIQDYDKVRLQYEYAMSAWDTHTAISIYSSIWSCTMQSRQILQGRISHEK